MTVERDDAGFDAPAPVGHPARAGLPIGQTTGPEIGERLPDFELADAQDIPYPRLSDIDSEVIQRYRILNTEVSKDDVFLHGIPFPGVRRRRHYEWHPRQAMECPE